jgi:hypothetical protein
LKGPGRLSSFSIRHPDLAVIFEFEFPPEKLIKTMGNDLFHAMPGLQFLAGVKECR